MGLSVLLRDPSALASHPAEFGDPKDLAQAGLGYLSYANGLMTAVIVGPDFVPPSEWLPLVTGDGDMRLDAENSELVTNAMFAAYDTIVESLLGRDNPYEPFFWSDGNSAVVTRDWAEGFLDGVNLRRDAWLPFGARNRDDGLLPVYILLQRDQILSILEESGSSRDEILEDARNQTPDFVAEVAKYWKSHKPGASILSKHAEKKPGRNDVCPCGSGRKYKKCCLN